MRWRNALCLGALAGVVAAAIVVVPAGGGGHPAAPSRFEAAAAWSGLVGSARVPVGTGQRVLVVLGAFSLVNAWRLRTPDPIAKSSLEPFVLVVASVVAFALLIDTAGLVVALIALVLISSLRRLFDHPIEVLSIAIGLAAFCVLLFSMGLGMAMPLWPW